MEQAKRVVLKLSGEALAGEKKTGFDETTVVGVAKQIKVLTDQGYQIGIIIGGGNFWRGRTSEKIDRTNQLLMEMAAEKGIYYLNVAEAFKDETGQMPDAASTDGLHFTSEYYIKWMDYLKTHAIKEEE